MKPLILLLMLLSIPFAHAALEFVPLSNSSPETIIPKIEPLLEPGESVIAGHGELIIRASEQTLSSLLPIIQNLDQPTRQLMIHVSRDRQLVERQRGYKTRGRAVVGLGAGNQSSLRGRISVFDDRSTLNEAGVQKIRALEGHPAFIATGVQEPLETIDVYEDDYHRHITQSTQYRDATKGVYVTPTLIRDKVVLTMSAWADEPFSEHGGAAPHYEASSTIRGNLNEWMQLGGIDERTRHNNEQLLGSQREVRSETSAIWVKVVEVSGD
jgi:hypothetical protein